MMGNVDIMDIKKLEKQIDEIMREAAGIMLHASNVMPESKTDARNVVTEYDRRVQEFLVGALAAVLPEAKFFCEENDRQDDLMAEHVFVIDPIDGTMNFVHGLNHSCISVAYASNGEILIGKVYNPYVDEMFSAVKGEGAYLNGKRIHADDAGLSDSLVLVGTAPYNVELADETFALMKKAFLAGLDVRRQGSAALDMCSVAAGRAGVYFELRVSIWDIAAGMLILAEAGGVSLNLDGREAGFVGERQSILAAGKKTACDFLTICM